MRSGEKEKTGLRAVLTFAVFLAFIGGFFILNRVVTPPELIASERRRPSQLEEFNLSNVTSAKFMNSFERFAADTFAFREPLRTVRAVSVFRIFMQTDKSGLYLGESGAGEFRAVNEASVEQAAYKITRLAESLNGLNLYYAFIPDKSIYSGMDLPGFDPGRMEQLLTEYPGMDALTFIPLTGALDAGCFYQTDLHWDQLKIGAVLDALGAAMEIGFDLSAYTETDAGGFRGVYPGQLALPMPPDRLRYLDNQALTARYFNIGAVEWYTETERVYEPERISGVDPYDVFLRGPQPLIELHNSSAATDRELFLFRDSFGSSIAPLLASAYKKVTLIDLRYINAMMLEQLITFTPGADVLFLYGSQIFNNSSVLLVR